MIETEVKEMLRPRLRSLSNLTALVTGASSGIGLAIAVKLAVEGCHLNLVARRTPRLEELKRELLKLNPGLKIRIFPLDLTAPKTIALLKAEKAFEVDIVINNAGLARGLSSIINSNDSDWNEMLKTNVTAAFQISKESAIAMAKANGGDIVAVSSIAAHFCYENGAVYCATKHAFRAFHETLRLETLDQNIRVMMFSPGMVETEFSLVRFNGDSQKAKKVYDGVEALNGGDVADSVVFALKQSRHINIDELVIKPRQQGNPWKVHRNHI